LQEERARTLKDLPDSALGDAVALRSVGGRGAVLPIQILGGLDELGGIVAMESKSHFALWFVPITYNMSQRMNDGIRRSVLQGDTCQPASGNVQEDKGIAEITDARAYVFFAVEKIDRHMVAKLATLVTSPYTCPFGSSALQLGLLAGLAIYVLRDMRQKMT
jgi:hypothetical protein